MVKVFIDEKGRFNPKTDKRGLHNWKNLFKKPTTEDIIILLLLLLTFFNSWSYNRDMNACQDFYEDKTENLYIFSDSNQNLSFSQDYEDIFKEELSINGSVT